MKVKIMVDSSHHARLMRIAAGMGEIANPGEVEMPTVPRVGDFVFLPVDEGGPLVVKMVTWTPFDRDIDAVVILEA